MHLYERSRLTRAHPGGIDIPDLYDSEHDGLYVLPPQGDKTALIYGYSDGGDSFHGAFVPVSSVIRALMPADIRSYLSDLIDVNDGGQEVEIGGHPEGVRERTIALLFGEEG